MTFFFFRSFRAAIGTSHPPRDWTRAGHVLVMLLAGCTLVGCDREPENQPPPAAGQNETAGDAKAKLIAAMQMGDWKTADRHAKAALISHPNDVELLAKIAQVTAANGRKREAAQLLVEAVKLGDFQPASRVDFALRAVIEVGDAYAAIDLLERYLQVRPDDHAKRRTLVGILLEVQRTDKIGPHMKALIENRAFDLNLLLVTTDTISRRLSEETSKRLLERNPDDLRVRLADAFVFLYRRDAAAAIETLESILDRHPDFAPAHAMYGQALALAERWDDLPAWLASAPAESSQFAGYWLTLGDVAIRKGEIAAAVHAYWMATRREYNSLTAWDRLGGAMLRLRANPSPDSDKITEQQTALVRQHANALLTLDGTFNDFAGGGKTSQRLATEVAKLLLQLGRLWEAEAWSAVATTLTQDPSSDLTSVRQQVLRRLQSDRQWIAEKTPERQLDFSQLPEPSLEGVDRVMVRGAVVPDAVTHGHVQFSEQSTPWGLIGVGAGNTPTSPKLAELTRSTGIGGGAIDYDLDGLPDQIVMNAGGVMLQQNSQPNTLLRNLGSSFVPIEQSVIHDRGYGQGVAVGDFNEDGFADLLFANLGRNRLLRNNGDGTFTDCSELLQDAGREDWSTSAAFMDLDGDGIADLVVTNYCKTVENLDKPCPKNGVPGPCHPLTFPAEVDQFFKGGGSGELRDVSAQWVPWSPTGRGLGIVAGRLDGESMALYIANDMTQNALYSFSTQDPGVLSDSAAAQGVAVDGLARSQASMGVAASDFDLDGDLDFYVTGFAREYNVYYEQIAPGLWSDTTGSVGLIEPTLMMVGFGAQAIDVDNDGIDEIMVTNGHIGEFDDPEAPPYELPLQLFRRGEDARFELIDDDDWGDYFRDSHAGRSLWTSDVNADGHNDVFVSHTHEQVNLLVNQTNDQNHRIAFKLVGTSSSRDAVGAVIRFECNGKSRTLWRLSGDGYMCSNEKTLIAGLGQQDTISKLTVTWQDGSVDRIGSLPADKQYVITQGMGEAFPVHDYDRR